MIIVELRNTTEGNTEEEKRLVDEKSR